MSAPFYSYDPCVATDSPCGACLPQTTREEFCGRGACCGRGPCCVCPGGGCSPCPAPVCPWPCPCAACPLLPCVPPMPPCEPPLRCPPPPRCLCQSVAIPHRRPNRLKPCPCYCCPPVRCPPCPCRYPGGPANACCGTCMPLG